MYQDPENYSEEKFLQLEELADRIMASEDPDEIRQLFCEGTRAIYLVPFYSKYNPDTVTELLFRISRKAPEDAPYKSAAFNVILSAVTNPSAPIDVIFTFPSMKKLTRAVSQHPGLFFWLEAEDEFVMDRLRHYFYMDEGDFKSVIDVEVPSKELLEFFVAFILELGPPEDLPRFPMPDYSAKESVMMTKWKKSLSRYWREVFKRYGKSCEYHLWFTSTRSLCSMFVEVEKNLYRENPRYKLMNALFVTLTKREGHFLGWPGLVQHLCKLTGKPMPPHPLMEMFV